MKSNKIASILMPVVVLTLIATVMALLLGLTNMLTEEPIKNIALQNEKAAVSKVIPADTYESAEIALEGKKYSYYVAKSSGVTVGYAFNVSGNGYGGAVTSIVGINIDGSISAIEITDISGETPGLGQNAGREDFKSAFTGKSNDIIITKNNPAEDEVKAVTGATITSNAVASSVNLAFDLYQAVVKEVP